MAQPRLAIAMWDFSWLGRRSDPHPEYADWDRVLDELCERGYDCVRIDAFPHLIAPDASGRRREQFMVLPEPYARQWGPRVPVTIEPRIALVRFVTLARTRGLRVGLSTWFNPDDSDRRSQVRTPADYARVWSFTLEVLAEAGLLDCIAWVDLCNEFPGGMWAYGAYREIFGTGPNNILPILRRWTQDECSRVAAYWRDAIPVLRAKFPGLHYTFSTMTFVDRGVRALEPSEFDLFEAHLWLTDDPVFAAVSLGILSLLQLPGGVRFHAAAAPVTLGAARRFWYGRLRERQRRLAEWAAQRHLPLYTTEGWATTNYSDLRTAGAREWRWVKEVCAQAVANAIEFGWEGICTSNFCQPHFPGMWRDIAWHRALTTAIHSRA